MALTRKTLEFLPGIFRTDTNRKFLGSTLDQLISEPEIRKLDNFVGRQYSETTTNGTNFKQEPSQRRQNYQLEPSLVVEKDGEITATGDYIDLLNRIEYYGGNVTNHDRLFESEYYTFDPFINIDKLVNYSQYYWLPDGPPAITIGTGVDSLVSNAYSFISNTQVYFVGLPGSANVTINPDLYLVRGKTYTIEIPSSSFHVGKLWIQSQPGQSGINDFTRSISTREIYGVTNNGVTAGQTITFSVPAKTDQNQFLTMPLIEEIDYVITSKFNVVDGLTFTTNVVISNQSLYPENKLVIFTDPDDSNTAWTTRNSTVVASSQRRGIWKLDTISLPNGSKQIAASFVRSIEDNQRLYIKSGTQAGREFYRVGVNFNRVPVITAPLDNLYYQNDTNRISGQIFLIDESPVEINVDEDIIGKINYTFNNFKFSNGNKVYFDKSVMPATYQNKTYIVEGVGVGIRLVDVDTLNEVKDHLGGPDYITISRHSIDLNGWSLSNRWFHIDVITQAMQINHLPFNIENFARAQRPIIEFKPDLQLFNSGKIFGSVVHILFDSKSILVQNAIRVPITNAFTQIDNQPFDKLRQEGLPLYAGEKCIFSADTTTAIRNKVYKIGYKDQTTSTAFSGTLTGELVAQVGNDFIDGSLTKFLVELTIGCDIFDDANNFIGRVTEVKDNYKILLDRKVTNAIIFRSGCKFIKPRVNLIQVLDLVPESTVVVRQRENTKKSYYLDKSLNWQPAQFKYSVNQAPLFDIVDSTGTSFKDVYVENTFAGCKLFSFKEGSTVPDPILKIPLSFQGVTDFIADINFVNNYQNDTFIYIESLGVFDRKNYNIGTNQGYVKRILSATDYRLITDWNRVGLNATTPILTKQHQIVSKVYDGITSYFEIGVKPEPNPVQAQFEPTIKVSVNNKMLLTDRPGQPPKFAYEQTGVFHTVKVDPKFMQTGDRVDIEFYSKTPSSQAYYEIPDNLEFNTLNEQVTEINLGQLRKHLKKISENTTGLIGNLIGPSNIRDINIARIPGSILQHSGGLNYAALFLNDDQLNFVDSLEFAKQEYTRFKNKFLELAATLPSISNYSVPDQVDLIIADINQTKTPGSPFYYSDMLPSGKTSQTKTIIVDIDYNTEELRRVYKLAIGSFVPIDTEPSTRSMLVYLNNQQLLYREQYSIESGMLLINNLVTLELNDVITVKEYENTDGNFVPETPTKLGFHPKFIPGKYLDDTYRTDTYVIQGHDGSLTPAFNDYRDDLLLEFEYRVFNNIKVNYNPNNLDLNSVVPGYYRSSHYTLNEFNRVLSVEFLKWIGKNHLDYSSNQDFVSNDEFTYNYNRSQDGATKLPGYWRGIYKFYYDTDRPHTHPWEMLGFSIKPTWWDNYYSWTDIVKRQNLIFSCSQGIVSEPGQGVINPIYARSGFAKRVPVDDQGFLQSPLKIIVQDFNSANFNRSFSIGDHGPAETAWRRSSEYPFALQRALALLKPARYFALYIDASRIIRDISNGSQFVFKSTLRRGGPDQIVINGENSGQLRASGYLNWVHAYLSSLNLDATNIIRNTLDNTKIKLTHRLGGFTDKNIISVLADQSSPASTNNNIVVPDENYQIFLNSGSPIRKAVYSAVIIEKTNLGWTVTGYDINYPYFTIIPGEPSGASYTLTVLNTSVVIFKDYRNEKIIVPYGYEFKNIQQVADFLTSYQRNLKSQGFQFNTYDPTLAVPRDWDLSIKEFITWNLQGWKEGTVLVLSPVSDSINFYSGSSAVDGIYNKNINSQLLGVNFNVIPTNEFTIVRDNKFNKITTISGQSIAFAELNLIQYEHILVFDNVTVFNDVLYVPKLGNRQDKLRLIGSMTGGWDGDLSPGGFVYHQAQVSTWQVQTDYKKGDIVEYKKKNYTATQNIVATDSFNFNYWVELDTVNHSELIPNFAQNATQFESFYDVDNLVIDENLAKFSTGLIGYRTRNYLSDLGLNNTTALKFYQGFIKDKGTKNALTALGRGHFDNVESSVEIFEEWLARVGEYGAIDSNPEITLLIRESVFNQNPVVLEFLNYGQLPESNTSYAIYANDLLTKKLNYTPNLFLNRNNNLTKDLFYIEMFGDSIICGHKPKYLEAYSIAAIKKVSYSASVELASENYSLTVVYASNGSTVSGSIDPGTRVDLKITSEFLVEALEYVIESPIEDENPSTISGVGQIAAGEVDPGTILGIQFTSYDSEDLSYSIEIPTPEDVPESTTSKIVLEDIVRAGEQLQFGITGIAATGETLYYSIEEVAMVDKPLAMSYYEHTIACTVDKNTNRIDDPPDYQLYEALDNDIKAAVITRSVGSSTSGDLLNGTDGANDMWPDQIDGDIIIINHGLRDALKRVSLSDYKQNLINLRRRLPAQKIIVWVTPTPVNLELTNVIGIPDPRLDVLRENPLENYIITMRRVAKQFGDYCVDTSSIPNYQNYLNVDGMHPTEPGYRALIEHAIAPVVRNAVRDLAKRKIKEYQDDVVSAGYVNKELVDELIFDITAYEPNAATLNRYYTGYKIWVAKTFNKDWQVYRANSTPLTVVGAAGDLDSKFSFIFDQAHDLKPNDIIAVRNFDSLLDGFYQVISTDEFGAMVFGTESKMQLLTRSDIVDRSGELFVFTSLRFDTPAMRDAGTPYGGWLDSDVIFVDDIGFGNWGVYKPKVRDVDYVTDFIDTYVSSNVYSIVGQDCDNLVDDLVTDVSDGDDINFTVTSVDPTEVLYWTVEEPSGDDIVVEVVRTGINDSVITTTELRTINFYDFDLLDSQSPKVDIESINNLYMFDYESKRILTRLDILDPAKGRILGSALQDIDYTTSYDPARYRYSDNQIVSKADNEFYWADEQVGTYWWNIDACRFVDYEQANIDYRIANWGKLFPGSKVEVYEWISSDVIPSVYVSQGREGIPLHPDDSRWSSRVYLDPSNNGYKTVYYFWVRGKIPKTSAAKRSSSYVLEDMITNPIAQGVPYLVAYKDNTIGLYNVQQFLKENKTALFISSKKIVNENIVHTDYKIIQEGNEDSKFPTRLENKIIDSIAGVDAYGRFVPDNSLPMSERLGYEQYPRQSVIANRFTARKNVILYVNDLFSKYPIAKRVLNKYLTTEDNFYANQQADPADYNQILFNFISLDNINPVNNNKVLVQRDETANNYWSIYHCFQLETAVSSPIYNIDLHNNLYNKIIAVQLTSGDYNIFGYKRIQRQSYNVANHWQYVNWYAPGFNDKTVPTYTIDTIADLYKIHFSDGDIVKVLQVPYGSTNFSKLESFQSLKFEMYQFMLVNGELQRKLVGMEDGTIKISEDFFIEQGFDSQNFDTYEFDFSIDTEFRYILKGLKEDILIAELENEYNKLLFFIVDYILSEQRYIDWFLKTSFITLKYKVYGLTQSPKYIQDRQQSFAQYINEVKPYRVKLRQYILNHLHTEHVNLRTSDFDVPGYYETSIGKFRKPNGEIPDLDQNKLAEHQYRDWSTHYKYGLESIDIASPGYGYYGLANDITEPEVIIARTDTEIGSNAVVRAHVGGVHNSITSLEILTPGNNYISQPRLSLIGTGGTKVTDNITHEFIIVSRGSNDTSVGTRRDYGLWYKRTNFINLAPTVNLGFTVHLIRRSDGKLISSKSYDTASGITIAREMAFDLARATREYVVAIHTSGNPLGNRLDSFLELEMYRCGASRAVYGSADFKIGSAYILIGIPGCGEGNGIENYQGAVNNSNISYANLRFRIRRGRLIPIAADPHIYEIGSAVSFSSPFPVGQVYTYANKQWLRTLTGWVVYKRPMSLLPDEKEFQRAILVPRLGRNPVRKIKTVIRFDRISYTSSVLDWQPNTAYSAGVYLSYANRVYVVKQNIPASPVFGLNFVEEVGTNEELANTRSYRNGFFDNANDRIMSYYKPSIENNQVPKDIKRLVEGLRIESSVVGSQLVTPDTILLADTLSSEQGIKSGNIRLSGGTFVDKLHSYSPEELVPGITSDTLRFKLFDNTDPTKQIKILITYRSTASGIARTSKFLDYDATYTTSLGAALNINDTTITVVDASRLATPNIGLLVPGIIEINGERISYYTVTGNVLGNIRRGVDGTGTPLLHPSGSKVEDAALRREITIAGSTPI